MQKKTKLPSDPAEQVRTLIAATLTPGARMLLYAHDTWCPAGDSHGQRPCICSPDVYLVEELPSESQVAQ